MDWNHTNEINKRSIAIIRVSSKQQENNTSMDAQEREINKYCKEYHLSIVEIRKIVESAKDSSDRKLYKDAIKFALKNRIRHILFYMDDRECRNLTDLEYNEKLVKSDRIVIHHVFNRRVLHKDSPASDILIRGFTGLINKDYSLRLSAKIHKGCLTKAEMSIAPYSRLPLGYIFQREKTSLGKESKRGVAYVVPDPDIKNVKQVQREFELRAQGLSLLQILRQIKKEGFIADDKVKSYRISSLEKRLKNKFYWGYFDWQGVEYKGNHELIIAPEILLAVKNSFKSNVIQLNRFTGLSGWIRCADKNCGMAVVYDPKTKVLASHKEPKTFHYYRCSNSRKVHHKLKSISEEKILNQLTPAVNEVAITEEIAAEIRKSVEYVHERSKEAIKAEAKEFRIKLKALEAEEDLAYKNYIDGVFIDKEAYKRQIIKIRAERELYEQKLEQANLKINDKVLETISRLLELSIHATSLLKSSTKEQLIQYIKTICSNCSYSFGKEIPDDSSIHYNLKNSFNCISRLKS